MTAFELKTPHTTPEGVTYQEGVVGDVIYHAEAPDPDGVLRTLVRIGGDVLPVPTASLRVVSPIAVVAGIVPPAAWTARQGEIIDEHARDFRKENDRNPDRGELIELLTERSAEEEGTPLAAELDGIIAVLAAS